MLPWQIEDEQTGERINGESRSRWVMLNNLEGVVYPFGEQFIGHTHTQGNMLSILFLAAVALMAVCTDYSAWSRKCVVAKAMEKLHGSQHYWSKPAGPPLVVRAPVCFDGYSLAFSISARVHVWLMCVHRHIWHNWKRAKMLFMKLVSFILDVGKLVKAAQCFHSWRRGGEKYPCGLCGVEYVVNVCKCLKRSTCGQSKSGCAYSDYQARWPKPNPGLRSPDSKPGLTSLLESMIWNVLSFSMI